MSLLERKDRRKRKEESGAGGSRGTKASQPQPRVSADGERLPARRMVFTVYCRKYLRPGDCPKERYYNCIYCPESAVKRGSSKQRSDR